MMIGSIGPSQLHVRNAIRSPGTTRLTLAVILGLGGLGYFAGCGGKHTSSNIGPSLATAQPQPDAAQADRGSGTIGAEPDQDNDGVSDSNDECPRERGSIAGRGCPQATPLVTTNTPTGTLPQGSADNNCNEAKSERCIALLDANCKKGQAQDCFQASEFYDGESQPALTKKIEYLKRACDLNHLESCYRSAIFEAGRKDGAPNYSLVMTHLEKSCREGNTGAVLQSCALLGIYLTDDDSGVPNDFGRARRLLQIGCEAGEPKGCFNLGILHEQGKGGPKSAPLAAKFYEKACQGKDAPGCVNLGIMQATGDGIRPDLKKAKVNFDRACELGDADGCAYSKKVSK